MLTDTVAKAKPRALDAVCYLVRQDPRVAELFLQVAESSGDGPPAAASLRAVESNLEDTVARGREYLMSLLMRELARKSSH